MLIYSHEPCMDLPVQFLHTNSTEELCHLFFHIPVIAVLTMASPLFVPAVAATVRDLWEVMEDLGKSPIITSIHCKRGNSC
jgi:hypothetical protein